MSTICCTFPGRAGDILWALPTIRALSRRLQQPIDLVITEEFAALLPLLQRQPYLGHVMADPEWSMADGWEPKRVLGYAAPGHPETLLGRRIIHLGYRRWPELPLAQETLSTFNGHKLEWIDPLIESELDLQTPWITGLRRGGPTDLIAGWSECHFEYKVGLTHLLDRALTDRILEVTTHSWKTRWATDVGISVLAGPWDKQAAWIQAARAFVGCNSGLHVLAVAVGTPVVMVEPMESRLNPIFFPVGDAGPQVTLVRGLDGLPTLDVRHTADAIRAAIRRTA